MNLMTKTLGKAIKPLSDIGLGKMPGVSPLYKFIWKHFGPKGIRLTKVNGFKMYVVCRDWAVAPTMLFNHVWEPVETKICKQHIKEGMTVVDAGAYIGYYSILASKLVGSRGKVYAFEPSPECLELLYKNIEINNCKNIQVFTKAVTDKVGYTMFYVNPQNLSGSSTARSFQGPQIEVPTTTLDEAIGNQRVDFIKMDIEGTEPKAIRGMNKVIRNNSQLKMIIEASTLGLADTSSSFEGYIKFLQSHFKLYIIGNSKLKGEVNLQDIKNAARKTGVINLFCQRRSSCV